MFNDKPQSDDQSTTNPINMNTDKEFPFKKIDNPLAEKKLTGTKGPVEDILAGTESDQALIKNIESEEFSKTSMDQEQVAGLKQAFRVPSMDKLGAKRAPVLVKTNRPISLQTAPNVSDTKPRNKIFIILIIIFIVIILGLAGVFTYQYFTRPSAPADNLEPSKSLQDLLNVLENTNNTNSVNSVNTQTEQVEENRDSVNNNIDSDNDGLTNEQEFSLGTNINKFDTDNDGLSDFEEVEIYGSNPINPDTDADGYKDGDEVEHGYDPLHAGSSKL